MSTCELCGEPQTAERPLNAIALKRCGPFPLVCMSCSAAAFTGFLQGFKTSAGELLDHMNLSRDELSSMSLYTFFTKICSELEDINASFPR